MTQYKKTIHDIQTNEVIEVNMTADEIAELEAGIARVKAERKIIEAEQEKAAIARAALLDKLGITADEAKLLLG